MESFNDRAHTAESTLDRQLQGEYNVDIGGFIRQAWGLFKQEPGKFIGFTLVLFVASMISQIIGTLSDPEVLTSLYGYSPNLYLIAGVGIVLSIVVSLLLVPLSVGMMIAGFKMLSGQELSFNDFFHGYRYWKPLVLLSVVIGIIGFLAGLLLAIPLILVVESVFELGSPSDMGIVFGGLLGVLYLVVLTFIFTVYIFAQPLIVDRRMGFWQAMEMSRKVVVKQWFAIFGFLMVVGLLSMLGVLALLVGLLATIPVAYLSLAVAYREIFGLESSDW